MGKKLFSSEGRFSLHWECLFPEGGVEGDTLGYYNTLEQLTPLAKEFGIANKILTRCKNEDTKGQKLIMFVIDHDTADIYDYCPWEQKFNLADPHVPLNDGEGLRL